MKIAADFVISAATARDFPQGNLGEIALVGRSNVGKSSLINALVRRSIARTSASPGKTRLANIYRVARGAGEPFHLVDLPGYGYARGGNDEFIAVTQAFFGQERRAAGSAVPASVAALLVVDSRHPGLESDIGAWRWLQSAVEQAAVVATKIDKLARGQRIRAMRELESVFDASVTPVSAATGEGLDELWKLMDRLANSRSPRSSPPKATAPRPPKR